MSASKMKKRDDPEAENSLQYLREKMHASVILNILYHNPVLGHLILYFKSIGASWSQEPPYYKILPTPLNNNSSHTFNRCYF